MRTNTVMINQFDGGVVNDPRTPAENACRMSQHFDVFTDKHRLTPYRSAVTGDSSASTNQIASFLYANGIVYGLGIASFGGQNVACLYQKTDLTNSTWSSIASSGVTPAGAIPAATARATADLPAFIYYATTAKFYGVCDARYIWQLGVGGSTSATNGDLTSYTNVSNFLNHSIDDYLYLGHDNKIASKNGAAAWTAVALTLPGNFVITSLAEFGNYLAIACRPKDRGRSKIFFWDRTSTTWNFMVDWGEGELYTIEELEGYLLGVSYEFATPGATTLDNQMMIQTRVAFRYYSGSGQAVKFEELVGLSTNPGIAVSNALSKQKANNRIFFPASIPIGTTGYRGIWSIGRNSTGAPFAVTLDRLLNNGTSINTMYGAFLAGDYLFFAYDIASVFGMDKTDSTGNYTATSLYETLINPGMPGSDRPYQKQLRSVALMYDPLPTGGQIVLKYRINGGAWTTILTETTVNAVITEQVLDAAGTQFTAGRELEFHIESTGGAFVTALIYKYQILATLL